MLLVVPRYFLSVIAVFLLYGSFGAEISSAKASEYLPEEKIEDATICRLVDEPWAFKDKLVRVHARYVIGPHFGILIDGRCSDVGVVLWSEPGSDGNRRLSEALTRDCRGVMNKELILSMVARYRWNPSKAEIGDFPRVLELQQLESMEVREIGSSKECDEK